MVVSRLRRKSSPGTLEVVITWAKFRGVIVIQETIIMHLNVFMIFWGPKDSAGHDALCGQASRTSRASWEPCEKKRVFFPRGTAQAEHTDRPLFSHAARLVPPLVHPAAQRSFVAVRSSSFTAVIRRRGLMKQRLHYELPFYDLRVGEDDFAFLFPLNSPSHRKGERCRRVIPCRSAGRIPYFHRFAFCISLKTFVLLCEIVSIAQSFSENTFTCIHQRAKQCSIQRRTSAPKLINATRFLGGCVALPGSYWLDFLHARLSYRICFRHSFKF